MKTILALLLLLTACVPQELPGPKAELEVEVSDVNLSFICTPKIPALELTMFNVSQGQSILLRIPKATHNDLVGYHDYNNIVYDAGPKIKGQQLPGTIDQLIVSNPDKDHLAGAAWILDTREVKKYVEPDLLPCTTNACAMVREKVANEPGIEVVTKFTGNRIYKADTPRVGISECFEKTRGGPFDRRTEIPSYTATIEYLSPDPLEPFKTDNDNSIVLLVTYGNTTILLMGDCERACENKLLEQHYPRDVDILIVGHHGSRSSSSQDFLNIIRPKIALISAGAGNQYGHPHQEVLDRLNKIGAKIYRTDIDGSITVTTDGNNIEVQT